MYAIVRFRFNAEREVIAIDKTLEEAQEHCSREDTHGEGWFDGYTEQTSFEVQEYLGFNPATNGEIERSFDAYR